MKDLSNLTDEELEQEVENHKSASERMVEEWAYQRLLNLEQIKRIKSLTLEK
jgi:hypothetical protein